MPYKEKPNNSMFGANYFADIDFARSMNDSQFFKQEGSIELSGIVLKLTDLSSICFDIKRFDLKTGQMRDFGFTI